MTQEENNLGQHNLNHCDKLTPSRLTRQNEGRYHSKQNCGKLMSPICYHINSSAARGSGNVLSIPCRQQTHPLRQRHIHEDYRSNLSRETEGIR